MMHQYFEMSIEQLVALDKEDFLELCSRYLVESLADAERRFIDPEARPYGRTVLGIHPRSHQETRVG
jgi:hypothetical protein